MITYEKTKEGDLKIITPVAPVETVVKIESVKEQKRDAEVRLGILETEFERNRAVIVEEIAGYDETISKAIELGIQ